MKSDKPRTKPFQWQVPITLFLLGCAVAGFLWVFLASPTETVTLDLQEVRVPLDEDQYALLQEPYQIKITSPRRVKAGKIFGYTFSLVPSIQPVNITAQDVNVYSFYQVNLILKPDFENVTINPPGSMTTALLPDQEPKMLWKMEAVGKEPVTGIFWAYLDFIPLEPESEAFSTAVLARREEIPVQSILGLNTNGVAILSTAFSIIAIFLGIPQLPVFRKASDAKS